MSPATPWTELTGPQTPYLQGIPSTITFTGLMLMDVPVPLVNAVIFIDPTVSWTEMSGPATAHTEMSTPSTPWTEVSI